MAGDLLVDRSVATILGAIGMFILFVTWKMRSGRFEILAPIGWIFTGFIFSMKQDPIMHMKTQY